MIPRPYFVFVLLLVVLGCASKDQALKPVEGSEDSKDGPTYLVGIIEFVNPEQQFVLIKAQSGITLPPGHTLTALDATGALSELVISPERKASHLTADIKSGNPRVGNLVAYLPKNQTNVVASTTESETTDGTTPAPGSTPLVPLSGAGTPYSGPPSVEWKEGQPLPFQGGTNSTNQVAPSLTPLPEENFTPMPTLPPVIE